MRNKDFCILMLEQEKQKRSNGDESTADLYRATRNHFAAFIREGEKSGLLGDVTQDVVQEFVLYLKGKKLRVNSVNSYISNGRCTTVPAEGGKGGLRNVRSRGCSYNGRRLLNGRFRWK